MHTSYLIQFCPYRFLDFRTRVLVGHLSLDFPHAAGGGMKRVKRQYAQEPENVADILAVKVLTGSAYSSDGPAKTSKAKVTDVLC